MHRLYENHKVLTYPRTDSRYLTSDVVGTLHERLQACSVGPVSYTHLDVYKRQVPEWVEADAEALKATVKELPSREVIDVPVDEMLIVELYSK